MTASDSASPAMQLAILSATYVRTVTGAEAGQGHELMRTVLRLLPAMYTGMFTLAAGCDDNGYYYGGGGINPVVTEEQYEEIRSRLAAVLGQNDMYLDASADDAMRYSDTPVAVSLAEQLADIYQTAADFAAAMADIADSAVSDVIADLADRFHTYLSDTICAAMRACNKIYQSKSLTTDDTL